MNANETKLAIRIIHDAGLIPLLVGNPGEAKSQLVRELAEEDGVSEVQVRTSACSDVADLTGMPLVTKDENGNERMSFATPLLLPTSGEGYFFFDEFNRGPKDIIQSMFQILDHGKLYDYTMPEGYRKRMVLAMNPDNEDHDVTSFMDKALFDRVVWLKVENSTDDWIEFMDGKYRKRPDFVSFIKDNPGFMTGKSKDFSISDYVNISKRSAERLVWLDQSLEKNSHLNVSPSMIYELYMGLVGGDTAATYIQWKENRDVKAIDAGDFLKNPDKYMNEIRTYSADETRQSDVLNRLNDDLIELFRNREEPLTETEEDAWISYHLTIPIDMSIGLINHLGEMAMFQRKDGLFKCVFDGRQFLEVFHSEGDKMAVIMKHHEKHLGGDKEFRKYLLSKDKNQQQQNDTDNIGDELDDNTELEGEQKEDVG